MISAIVTLSPDADTLGALRTMLADADTFGVDDADRLLDGAHASLDGVPVLVEGTDLAALRRFVQRFADLPDDTVVLDATVLALDLEVARTDAIACGSHVGEMPTNVVVTVHPTCVAAACWAE